MAPFTTIAAILSSLALAASFAPPPAKPKVDRGPFAVNGAVPTSVDVVGPWAVDRTDAVPPRGETIMQSRQRGILGALSEAEVEELVKAIAGSDGGYRPATLDRPLEDDRLKGAGRWVDRRTLADLRVSLNNGSIPETKPVKIVLANDGTLGAYGRATRNETLTVLRSSQAMPVVARFSRYAGKISESGVDAADGLEPGKTVTLKTPYEQSFLPLNQQVVRDRMSGPKIAPLGAVKRTLMYEQIVMRLPKGYSSGRPAGVFVWINNADSAEPPEQVAAVCDELNLAYVSAGKIGDERALPDRCQLVMDSLTTALPRFHADHARVFVGGAGKAGHVAVMVQVAFPEFFAGAVSIGKLPSYTYAMGKADEPAFVPEIGKPTEPVLATLTTRRISVVAGPKCADHAAIKARAKQYDFEKVGVKVFEFDDATEAMTTRERLLAAVNHLDEPVAKPRAESLAAARKQWEAFNAGRKSGAPLSAQDRVNLAKIADTAPWSDVAWKAVRLLETH